MIPEIVLKNDTCNCVLNKYYDIHSNEIDLSLRAGQQLRMVPWSELKEVNQK